MITRLEAYRYRCFSTFAVDFQAYNILAGPNGSGKTTLLDIPVLLGDCIEERVCSDAFLKPTNSRGSARAHDLPELIHQARGTDFVLVLECKLPEELVQTSLRDATANVKDNPGKWLTHLRYEVRFEVYNGRELHVLNEYLYLYPEKKPPTLGGGLQGEPELAPEHGSTSLKLRNSSWRSIIHRDKGDPARIAQEGYSRRAKPYRFGVPKTRLALASLPFDPDAFPAAVWFQEMLSAGTVYYEPNYQVLRKASPPGRTNILTRTGENLAWLALDLKRSDQTRYDYWVDHIRTALPQIEQIEPREREEDHHAYFRVAYKGGYQVTSSGLSEGTLRIIALTLVAYVLKAPPLLVIEQPEDGIHPKGIEPILQSLSSVADSQVWLSTHSPIVLAQSQLEQLLLTRTNAEGSVQATKGSDHPRFKEWKGDLDLGTFYSAGVLD